MRLLELMTRATVGFSPTSQSKLDAGYTLLVPPTLRVTPLPELLSALFYSDGRGGDGALADGQGASVLLVLQAPNGGMYRLVRQLGGRGALYQMDAESQRWQEICREARDITSVLRSSCGLPTKGQFESIFCFSPRFVPPTMEKDKGLGVGGGGLRLGLGTPGAFGGPAGLPGTSGRLSGAPPTLMSTPLSGSGRSFSSPSLQIPQAALPPPLPSEEAQAIREKLLAELAAGKALDAWQFELEGLQQRFFQHRDRLSERDKLAGRVEVCETELQKLGPSLEERGMALSVIERATTYDAAVKRRETSLKDLKEEVRKLQDQRSILSAKPPWKRPAPLISALVGLTCLMVGVAFYGSPVGFAALLSIFAFGYSAFIVLGWIDETQLQRGMEQRALRLKEGEQKLIEGFERDYGQVRDALRSLKLSSGQEVLLDRQQRATAMENLAQARETLEHFEAVPEFQQSHREIQDIEPKISELEAKIDQAALLATRDHHLVESELKALEARQNQQTLPVEKRNTLERPFTTPLEQSQLPHSGVLGADERIPALLRLALDLWPGVKLETVGPMLKERVGQYWIAFTQRTDRRIEFNTKAELSVLSTEGTSLPSRDDDEQELLYWSVRLALLEKLVMTRPIPIVLEEPCAGWTEPRAQLFSKALAHLGKVTQVLHVSALPVHRGLALATCSL